MRKTFSRVKEIFSLAIEIDSPVERDLYIQQACRDDADLLREVASLIAAHDSADKFLSEFVPHSQQTRCLDDHNEFIETTVGPYRLREKLGEGGMGVVYVAEQFQPVRRKVALKIIKPGMDSKQLIARFEVERQALAVLSHPNIARFLDAGTTDENRPYFVMELVRGIPIHKFCNQHKLTIRQRLELFSKVCQAVQHSHLKGIIHRDLKPNNVLVEEEGVEAIPKVIDFGIAKALNQGITPATVYTHLAHFMGTPDYMSPEQARLSASDVDTRSDVYSLGVMLYVLLTGTLPFEADRTNECDWDEIRRRIREEEPPRPSHKVSTFDNQRLSTISSQRQSEPRELSLSMRRELDWIVMRALEKNRSRRYQSANALAQDIRRYLNNERVHACPPSQTYRFKKFVARHRTFAITTALVLITVLIGSVTSFLYARKASSAAAVAIAAKADAEREAQASNRANFRSQQLLYAIDMKLAHQSWMAGDLRNFNEILDRYAKLEDFGGTDLRGIEWWLLKRIGTVESQVIATSDEQACLTRFSPDGRYLVIGWTDGSIEVKDATNHKTLMVLQGGGYFVYGCDFHPNGNILATIGDDGVVRLWDLAQKALLRSIPAFENHGHRVFFSADGKTLATSGESGRVRFWDTGTGRSVGEIDGFSDLTHAGIERRLACSPDRNLLAIADGEGNAEIFDFQTRRRICELEVPVIWNVRGLRCICFSSGGRLVAGGGVNNRVYVWQVDNGRLLREFEGHLDDILDLAFHPDGQLLASSDRSGTVRLWNLSDKADNASRAHLDWPHEFHVHDDRVLSLDFSTDGTQLVTGSRDYSARIQHGRGRGIRRDIEVELPRAAKFIKDGTELLVASAFKLQLWNVISGEIQVLNTYTEPAAMIVVLDDGLTAITGHSHRITKTWNLTKNVLEYSTPKVDKSVAPSNMSSVNDLVASSGFSGNGVVIQKFKNGRLLEPETALSDFDGGWLSPDKELLILHRLNELHVMDLKTREFIKKFVGHTNTVKNVAFSQDGRLMASVGKDRTIRLWDVTQGRLIHTILAHNSQINTVVFLPDNRTIVSGDEGGNVVFSHVATGRSLFETQYGDGPCRGLEVSPDGQLLAIVQNHSLVVLDIEAARHHLVDH